MMLDDILDIDFDEEQLSSLRIMFDTNDCSGVLCSQCALNEVKRQINERLGCSDIIYRTKSIGLRDLATKILNEKDAVYWLIEDNKEESDE